MHGLEKIEDKELVREILEREQKAKIEVAEAIDSVSKFKRSSKLDYLLFLQRAIELGNEIDDKGWSNFIFNGMYTIDKDFVYNGKTYGAHSLSFILKEGCSLELNGDCGHETVYDMNLGIARSLNGDRQNIPLPRECLKAYRIMKKFNIKPNWLLSII